MSNVTKLNTLVTEVFGNQVEDIETLWHQNSNVQKQLKTLCSGSNSENGRKKKDPNAPKRGKSAYLFFCDDNRNEVKLSLGEDSKATEVTKELGKRWRNLQESKKASDKKVLAAYEKRAQEDKARYEAEKQDYVPPEDFDLGDGKKRRKKMAKDGPKRAKSAYLFFCADIRDKIKEANPDMKATQITAELGRMWNELKGDDSRGKELAEYEKQALQDKERYEKEKSQVNKEEPIKKAKGKAKGKAKESVEVKDEVVEDEVVEDEVVEDEVVDEEVDEKSAPKGKGKGKGKGKSKGKGKTDKKKLAKPK
jgi:hypothetical protein